MAETKEVEYVVWFPCPYCKRDDFADDAEWEDHVRTHTEATDTNKRTEESK